MGDIQITKEILVEIPRFYNVDLFQRGYFQVRLTLKPPPKIVSLIECECKEVSEAHLVDGALFNAFVEQHNNTAVSKTFEIYYRHEEVIINDVFLFRIHMLLDSSKIKEQFPSVLEFSLELYFAECTASPSSAKLLQPACSQILRLHQTLTDAFHYHRSILFDYFHLGSVSMTMHSSIVAVRQPWLGSLTTMHPLWSSKSSSKQILHSGLFGKVSSGNSDQTLSMKQHKTATNLHRNLCHALLKMYESVLWYFHHAMSSLPEYAQMRVSQPDIVSKLDVLCNEFCNMNTPQEMITRLGDDLYLLSTELTMLWGQFVEQFTLDPSLVEELVTIHHNDRMRHLSEAFFVQDYPWSSLHTGYELSLSQHSSLSGAVKGSQYFKNISPIQLECGNLDGDIGGTPIIFEDRYIPGSNGDQASQLELSVEESLVGDFVDLDVSVHDVSSVDNVVEKPNNGHGMPSTSISTPCTTKMAWTANDEEDPEFSFHQLADETENNRLEVDDNIINSPTSSSSKEQVLMTTEAQSHQLDDADEHEIEIEIEIEGLARHSFERNASYKAAAEDSFEPGLQQNDIARSPNVSKNGGVMSCFPKGGRKRSKSGYKMTLLSPGFENKPNNLLTKFEKAKQHLKISLNYRGQFYSDITDPSLTKPYFTERILSSTENVHLVICVHGLDGNSGDLRLVKCYLELSLPTGNFDFLMSEVNQEDTFCDIDRLTDNLCKEIVHYIEINKMNPTKISFVGHSLGNIIIRNAVVNFQLMPYRGRFFTFLSLSGPHLGMLYHTSSLVSTGMWLMKKWKKAGSIMQLSLADSQDLSDTFMYRLSLTNGFQYFKNVLLVGSVQDHYVPFHSARLENCKQAQKDTSSFGRIYQEMLDNILKPLEVQEEINIVRYSVYHSIPNSANSFIGRAAHIAMLDSELFIEKLVLVSACKYFQ